MKQKLPKLVRDHILQFIEETGSTCIASYAKDREEHQTWLSKKMQEEVEEFIENPSYGEAADMLEVIKMFCHLNDLDFEVVINTAQNKQETHGGFYQGTILEYVNYEKK
jgi:predicted house-cleaning noncanonical NTP pyrophosphatase (MazG superfamily)